MNGGRTAALAAVLALAGAALPAHAGTSANITVYTWTDAAGVTHFSDKPRPHGPARKLLLPRPPPPDQTALAAQRAWLHELDRDWRASQKRAAAERLAEARSARPAPYTAEPSQYVPVFLPYTGHRGHRHRRAGRRGRMPQSLPDVRFPQYALPSSFPDPLASSFPGLPAGSFPEARGGSPAPPHPR